MLAIPLVGTLVMLIRFALNSRQHEPKTQQSRRKKLGATAISLLIIAGLWTQYWLQRRESAQKETMLAPFRELASERYPNAQSPEEAIGLLARDALGLPELILLPERTVLQYDPATGVHQATYLFRSRHNTVLTDVQIHMRFKNIIGSGTAVVSLTSPGRRGEDPIPISLHEDTSGLSCSRRTLPAGGMIEIHVESRHPLPNEPEVHLRPHPTAPAR